MNQYIGHFDVDNPSEIAALLKLRLIEISRLPALAEALLVKGYDAKALRRLAAEEPDRGVELVRWFNESNRDLGGQEFATQVDAATWLIRDLASRIVAGTLDAYEGARIIWMISLVEAVGSPLETHPFIYTASEYEDRPEDRQFFKQAIIDAARRLLEKPLAT
jgi:hypothetical protein